MNILNIILLNSLDFQCINLCPLFPDITILLI